MKTNIKQAGFSHIVLPVFVLVLAAIVGVFAVVAQRQTLPEDTASLSAKSSRNVHHTGYFIDVSKPQCDGKLYFKADRAVIGVNGYTSRSWNPCLKKQANLVRNYSLYIVASYNNEKVRKGPCQEKTGSCYAYNYGYKMGGRNYDHARRKGVISTLWWIDVEIFQGGWGSRKDLNRAYLDGLNDGLVRKGVKTVGYYAPPSHWGPITGGWQNGKPLWYATGQRPKGREAALKHCGIGFNGGPTWLVQYVADGQPGGELDVNYACHDDFSNGL